MSQHTLSPVSVAADDIQPGDRLDRAGRIRYVSKGTLPSGGIVWRTQTRGARGANVRGYQPDEQVTVYRKVDEQ